MSGDAKKLIDDLMRGLSDPFGVNLATLTQVLTCKACKQKNRVNVGKTKPRCGKCGLPL